MPDLCQLAGSEAPGLQALGLNASSTGRDMRGILANQLKGLSGRACFCTPACKEKTGLPHTKAVICKLNRTAHECFVVQ